MQIQENISLQKFNTFGIDVTAKYFAAFSSVEAMAELIAFAKSPKPKLEHPALILGGGSNILFTQNFNGLVMKNELRGIELVKEDEEHVYIKAAAGENWHQFVLHCINNNWAGVENLSLIPGNVGASPMQNIGAYGVEIKNVFHSLEAFDIADGSMARFELPDCRFGYRESIFKRKHKGRYIICSVTYKLRKRPVFNISYGAIEQELERMAVKELSIKAVSDAVINIRRSKLPDPAVIGNAGSFFKNPETDHAKFLELKAGFPGIVGYDMPGGRVKLAAGWLIEQCGPAVPGVSWKGYREGDAGCHAKQALVLVNYGTADGNAVYRLSERIIKSVEEKFGITLEREVNII